MSIKENIINRLRETRRDGIEQVIDYMQNNGFFDRGCHRHHRYDGGLADHAWQTYQLAMKEEADYRHLHPDAPLLDDDSLAICALLHDVCKVNKYVLHSRNIKNEATGQWEKVPYYSIEENKFPYGHGEGSVWLIQRFMRLSLEESIAIRWHMGGFDDAAKGYDLSAAFRQFPNAMLLHIADMKATYLLDR